MSSLPGYQRATRFLNIQDESIKVFLLKKLGRNIIVEVADYAFPDQEYIKALKDIFDLFKENEGNTY